MRKLAKKNISDLRYYYFNLLVYNNLLHHVKLRFEHERLTMRDLIISHENNDYHFIDKILQPILSDNEIYWIIESLINNPNKLHKKYILDFILSTNDLRQTHKLDGSKSLRITNRNIINIDYNIYDNFHIGHIKPSQIENVINKIKQYKTELCNTFQVRLNQK